MLLKEKYTGIMLEARRLSEDNKEAHETTLWLNANGFEWLLGDATQPDTLVNSRGETDSHGIYIDPKFGELVIRNPTRSVYRASAGMWITKQFGSNRVVFFVPRTHEDVLRHFVEVGNPL